MEQNSVILLIVTPHTPLIMHPSIQSLYTGTTASSSRAPQNFIIPSVIAQLLFLEKQDPEKDITLYVNSPGGQVTSTMAMYDTMQHVKPDVSTVCQIGRAS